MALTNVGRNLMTSLAVGGAGTPFNNANSWLGVGDSTTAFAAAQTDLQSVSNKFRQSMDLTFPTLVTNVLVFQATYTIAQANFAWNEWGVFNAGTAGVMLNRKVESPSLGTKPNTQSWVLTATITINNP